MSNEDDKSVVPPFVPEKQSRQVRADKSFDMLVGWLALTVAMVGGGKILAEYLLYSKVPADYELTAAGITLFLTYVLGWSVSLTTIRKFNNLIMPVIVRAYAWFVAGGIILIYGRAIYKIYFGLDLNYLSYTLVMFGAYLALVSLYLLEEDYELRHFAKPMVLMIAVHLTIMMLHYVFFKPEKPEMIVWDVYFLVVMMALIVLMVQKWLYRPFQNAISSRFPHQ